MRRLDSASIATLAALGCVVWLLFVFVFASGSRQRPSREAPAPRRPAPEVVIGGAAPAGRERAGARATAQRFLAGYIEFLDGRAVPHELPAARLELRRRLGRARVRVPPARAERTSRIVGLRVAVQAPGVVRVTASVDDGDLAPYPIVVVVQRRGGRWLVARVLGD